MFEQILGQAPAVETLSHALKANRVHHAYRFEGPAGVGKELTALAFAQTLLCPNSGCGECSSCRRAETFSEEAPHVPLHPDLVLLGRQLYPTSIVSAREANGISVEQVRRVVLSRAGFTPHEGRALVFIIRDAEELTVSAANALLKTLEEPGESTHFVLLTSQPHRLLDTVLSRTLAVRFRGLSEEVLGKILEMHGKARKFAAYAHGSAREALALADSDQSGVLTEFIAGIDQAITSKSISDALAFAGNLPRDKQQLRQHLHAYGHALSERLQACVGADTTQAELITKQYAALAEALDALERNTAAGLAVEAMLVQMRGFAPSSA